MYRVGRHLFLGTCFAEMAILTLTAVLVAETAAPSTAPSAPPLPTTAPSPNGSVRGQIMAPDGRAAAGLSLRLIDWGPVAGGCGPGAEARWRDVDPPDRDLKPWNKVIARITTDHHGYFLAHDVPPGYYTLKAGSDEVGWIYEEIEVEAGEETDLGARRMVKLDRHHLPFR
jgi:hypothetical protein